METGGLCHRLCLSHGWWNEAVKAVGLSTASRRMRWCRLGSKHKEMIGMNCIGEARTERPFLIALHLLWASF